MRSRNLLVGLASLSAVASVLLLQTTVSSESLPASPQSRDPGVRAGPGAGAPIENLSVSELTLFTAGKLDFEEVETPAEGLGPRMNLDSCGGCHSQPAIGGTSPAGESAGRIRQQNGATECPVVHHAERAGARSAIRAKSRRHRRTAASTRFHHHRPTRRAGLHARAAGFRGELARRNVIFRIPTPIFGAGLIEQIPDSAILANQASTRRPKSALGIRGRPNIVVAGNHHRADEQQRQRRHDRPLRMEGAEQIAAAVLGRGLQRRNGNHQRALSDRARRERGTASLPHVPNNVTNTDGDDAGRGMSAIEKFAFFMRFLAPPRLRPIRREARTSIATGKTCSATSGARSATRRRSRPAIRAVAALRNQPVNLFSDLWFTTWASAGRRRQPGTGGPERVPDRAAVGARPADFLPARRAHLGT